MRIQLRGAAGLGRAQTTRIPNGEGERDIAGPSRVSCNAELALPRLHRRGQLEARHEHMQARNDGSSRRDPAREEAVVSRPETGGEPPADADGDSTKANRDGATEAGPASIGSENPSGSQRERESQQQPAGSPCSYPDTGVDDPIGPDGEDDSDELGE